MKNWLILFVLALLVLGACQKHKAHYSLICQFPPFFANGSLVVTDYKGRVLGVERIATGQTSFQGDFELKDEDAPDSFDVHLIYTQIATHNTYWVYSQLGVYNASSLVINPLPANNNTDYTPHVIQIRGVQSLESLKIPESIAYYGFAHDPVGELVNIVVYPEAAEGTVLHIKANLAAQYSALYIPDEVLQSSDTLVYDLASFEAVSQMNTLVFESGPLPDILRVEVVSPDFRHRTPIFYQNSDFASLNTAFYRPASVPASWLYRVAGTQAGVAFDRIYGSSEPLLVKTFDKSVSLSRKTDTQLSLSTNGTIEVIKLSTILENPQDSESRLYWQVSGRPASFATYEIPDFGDYLPDWANQQALFRSGLVRAASFDKYDYVQIQAGFPYTLNEPFVLAKSGYEELWEAF